MAKSAFDGGGRKQGGIRGMPVKPNLKPKPKSPTFVPTKGLDASQIKDRRSMSRRNSIKVPAVTARKTKVTGQPGSWIGTLQKVPKPTPGPAPTKRRS